MNLVVFGIILIIVAAAFAVPFMRYTERRMGDADAVVLGAVILSMGLGTINLGFLAAGVILGTVPAYGLVFGSSPIVAGLLGAYVVRNRLHDARRLLALIGAAGLALAGVPSYFALSFALFMTAAAAALFLLGLVSPLRLFKALDPRN